MFSKMSNKTLAIVLLVLGVALYFAIFSDHSDSSYKNEVVNIDTAKVTTIKFSLPDKDDFELIKSGNNWMVKSGNTQSDADQNRVKALLTQMAPLKTIRVGGNLSDNAQIEQYIIDNNKELYDFHREWMDEAYTGNRLKREEVWE